MEVDADWRADRGAAGAGVLVNGLYTPEGTTCGYEVAVHPDAGRRETRSGIVSGDSGQDLPISVPLEGVRPPFDWGFKMACGATASDREPVYDLGGRVDSASVSTAYAKDRYAGHDHGLVRSRDLVVPLVVVSYERVEAKVQLTADLATEQDGPVTIQVTTSQGVETLTHTPADPFKLGPVDVFHLSSINPDAREEFEIRIEDRFGRNAEVTGHFNYDRSGIWVSISSNPILGQEVLIGGQFTMSSTPLAYPNPAGAESSKPIGGAEVETEMKTRPLDPRSVPLLEANMSHKGKPVAGVVGVGDGKRTRGDCPPTRRAQWTSTASGTDLCDGPSERSVNARATAPETKLPPHFRHQFFVSTEQGVGEYPFNQRDQLMVEVILDTATMTKIRSGSPSSPSEKHDW